MKRYYTDAVPKAELPQLLVRYGRRGSEFDEPGEDMALAKAWFGRLPSFVPPSWPLLNVVVQGRAASYSREWLDRVVGSFGLISHLGHPGCLVRVHTEVGPRGVGDELRAWMDGSTFCVSFYLEASSLGPGYGLSVAGDVVRELGVSVEVKLEQGRVHFASQSRSFQASTNRTGFSWRFDGSSAGEIAARVEAIVRSIAVGESQFSWSMSMRDVDKWVQAIDTIKQLGWPGEVFTFRVSAEDVRDSDFCEYFAQYCQGADEVQASFRHLPNQPGSLYVVADATGWRVVLETEDPAVAQRITKKTGVPWVEERDPRSI